MQRNRIPEREFQEILANMALAESSGELDKLFQGECKSTEPKQTRKGFLQSIKPGMRLFKSFFVKAYSYEKDYPGTAAEVVERLQAAGCSKASEYYSSIADEQEKKQEEVYKNVARWYKGVSVNWRRSEAAPSRTKLQRSTERLQLLKRKKELLIKAQSATEGQPA